MRMLENLSPAEPQKRPKDYRPGIEYDGTEGIATTPGYESEPENFDEFLQDAGLDPDGIEVIPPVRTSRWQQQKDGEVIWLTAYKFTFRRKASDINLPLLLAEGKKQVRKRTTKAKAQPKTLVIGWSDLQVGKVDWRGGTTELWERVGLMQTRLEDLIKDQRPEKVLFVDLGDTIENFSNKADMQQAVTNDLSITDQVDVATTMAWQTIKQIYELVPDMTYASVGSNHCQWRINKQAVGKATDDWGVFIGRQLARLAAEKDLNIRFLEPQEWDESLAVKPWEDDDTHIVGIVHGHQTNKPEGLPSWWRGQAFGNQPVSDATLLLHGHFHHLRIQELGMTPSGRSRFIVGAPTMDNGSNWFRQRVGESAVPGLATLILEKGTDYTGTVYKL